MLDPIFFLAAIVVIALVFDFTNGAHDSANAIATIVSTKVLSPRTAVLVAAVLNLGGAFIGDKVATTIGGGIVHIGSGLMNGGQTMVMAALLGAIFWNLLTWHYGLPSSSSHALIGGLIGAAVAHGDWQALNYASIVKKVLLPLVLSPLSGFVVGYGLMLLLFWTLQRQTPRMVNTWFRKLQIVSSAFMATSHGMNDAQKTMGIITLALYIFGEISEIHVPLWVKIACALAMALGTAMGGWKIVKTMGHRIFKLEPVHGFAAETGAALVITSASLVGAPISTTHTIAASILGVGASKRLSAVRWGIAGNMIIAWVLTIPAAGLVAALCFEAMALCGINF